MQNPNLSRRSPHVGKAQIGFMEKLCRDGQQDGETAYGVLTNLSPELTGAKAPWCQIIVETQARVPEGATGEQEDDPESTCAAPLPGSVGEPGASQERV